MNDVSNDTAVIIKRFELWVSRLVQISRASLKARCDLADIGVVTAQPAQPPGPKDAPRVVRLKEALLTAQREREEVIQEMTKRGAALIDPRTYEIGLLQGPEPGRWLSWMPGEDDLQYYREEPTTASPRRAMSPHTPPRGSKNLH